MNKKIEAFVKSRLFFYLVISFFVIQAMWLAVSARFPMAFDEAYHVGIIQIYAKQWSPLLAHQPPGPAPYGALTVDPSYLFHYLMSFPYRIFSSFISNQVLVVVLMRFINVAFFAASIVLFRRVLLKTKASAALVNITLLFFVLIPVVPLLAAHVNYDNLLILLVALTLLIALKFREQLEHKRQCNAGLMLHTLSFCMLASLVKYAYLPIFLAIIIYLLYILIKYVGSPSKLLVSFRNNWRTLTRVNKTIALSVFVLSLGLFSQRYVINVVRYHNFSPQCGQLISVERCLAYPPWARNYKFAEAKTTSTGNPILFIGGWTYGMFYRSFFAINGPGGPSTYDSKPPLPILAITAVVVFCFGVYLVIRYRGKLFKHDPALNLLLLVTFVYILVLLIKLYHSYVHLGQLLAINGRYLVLVMPLVLIILGLGYYQFIPRARRGIVALIVFLLFLQGGGTLSYINDSNQYWFRSDSQFVTSTNHKLHNVIDPLIIDWPTSVSDTIRW